MDVQATTLPEDVSVLQQMIRELLEVLRAKDREIGQMAHRLDLLLRRIYGRRSEKLDPNQLALFQEVLHQLAAEAAAEADAPTEPSPKPKRRGHGRRKLPEDLPRRRVVHEVPPEEKICPCCDKDRTKIGEEVSEQLDYEPASLYVVVHVVEKYACLDCEDGVVRAVKPRQPIEKGLPGPGLLAHVITSKYCDHLPLYRQERILRRLGVDLRRSTLCGWMRQGAELLRPLYDVAARAVRCSKVIGTDDTPVRVQDPLRKGRMRTGRFWVYVGDEAHPYTVYDYTPSRSRDGPVAFLGDYEGYLQADAFAGYDGIYAGQRVWELLCWAHARRKFYEAQASDAARSVAALGYIRALYKVESEAQALFAAQEGVEGAEPLSSIRLRLRQETSVPLLAAFRRWMESQTAGSSETGPVLPKSPMGRAIDYCLSNWEALRRYTTDGDLAIDNNAAERALRGIAVGRKNWLFAGSDNGGRTAAILYSLVESAKRHGLDPFAYLRDVIARISDHPAARVDELLPDRWTPPPSAD
jgi:transposase